MVLRFKTYVEYVKYLIRICIVFHKVIETMKVVGSGWMQTAQDRDSWRDFGKDRLEDREKSRIDRIGLARPE